MGNESTALSTRKQRYPKRSVAMVGCMLMNGHAFEMDCRVLELRRQRSKQMQREISSELYEPGMGMYIPTHHRTGRYHCTGGEPTQ
jgi:hypothetical protein